MRCSRRRISGSSTAATVSFCQAISASEVGAARLNFALAEIFRFYWSKEEL